MKKSDTLSFTWESLQKELDTYRARGREDTMTQSQKDFIVKCRENDKPVPYSRMAKLWAKLGWGNISKSTLHGYYQNLRNDVLEQN
jgi:hypothetical protein